MKGPPESSGFGPQGSAGERGASRAPEKTSRRERKRLRHADFQRVYQQGRRHFAGHMTVFFLARDWGQGARVGFTVGRALGNAVTRNRIRRRLREAVRTGAAGMERAVDVVINPKKSVLTVKFAVLRQEVTGAFGKIQSSVAGRQSSEQSSVVRRQSSGERE